MDSKNEKTVGQKYINFAEAVVIFLLVAFIPIPDRILTIESATLTFTGRVALGILLFCLFLWITEPIPFHITGILGIILMLFLKVDSFSTLVKQGFGSDTITFFIGVLTLSAMITRTGLGRRISLFVLSLTGNKTSNILLGFLIAGTLISMWVTDMAVAAMLTPLAISMLEENDMHPKESNFGKALMISCAWGPIIGGVGTPAGAGPNQIAIGFLRDMVNINLSFLEWMKYGVPAAIVLIFPTWFLLLKTFTSEKKTFAKTKEEMKEEFRNLPPLSKDEKTTVIVFAVTVILWLTADSLGKLLGISIPTAAPALLCVVLLFLPGASTVKWKDIQNEISWDSIILIATGISIGLSVYNAGAAEWLAMALLRGVARVSPFMQILLIILIISFLKIGLSSNTVTATVIIPIMIALATAFNLPMMGIIIPSCLTLSLAFILVTSTPTSVIPYTSGYFSIADMAKTGTALTVISSVIMACIVFVIGKISGIY